MPRLHAPQFVLPIALMLTVFDLSAQPPPDGKWEANATLEKPTTITVQGLGAMQGVSFHDGKVYLYGDVWDAKPRVGVIREYTTAYEPTGRVVWLRREGKPLLR